MTKGYKPGARAQYFLRNPPDGGAEKYIEAEAQEVAERRSRIVRPEHLKAEQPQRPPVYETTGPTRLSTNPQIDCLVADLYDIATSQTSRLREKIEQDPKYVLEVSELTAVTKLADVCSKITRLQLEREKHEELDGKTREELIAETRATLAALESGDG